MKDLLILREFDEDTASQAKRLGLEAVVSDGSDIEFDRAIFVEPGVTIPWDLLPSGLRILERWDVAAPLWRYGVLARDVGTPEEQKRTEAITLDLRVLLYAHELLFVRGSKAGKDFLAAWREELSGSMEPRLAFLRALYRTKPIFCALPRSWIAEVRDASGIRLPRQRVEQDDKDGWISIEVRPGLYVKCRPGTESATLERYHKLQSRKRRQ